MIKLFDGGAWLIHGTEVVPEQEEKKAEALAGHALSKRRAEGNDCLFYFKTA